MKVIVMGRDSEFKFYSLKPVGPLPDGNRPLEAHGILDGDPVVYRRTYRESGGFGLNPPTTIFNWIDTNGDSAPSYVWSFLERKVDAMSVWGHTEMVADGEVCSGTLYVLEDKGEQEPEPEQETEPEDVGVEPDPEGEDAGVEVGSP